MWKKEEKHMQRTHMFLNWLYKVGGVNIGESFHLTKLINLDI